MQPEQTPPEAKPSAPDQLLPQKKSIHLPLFLMLWPIGVFLLALLSYALLNLLMPDQAVEGSLFAQPHPVKTVINTVLFYLGACTVLFGPITFIVGLVLLIQRKSKSPDA